MSNERPLMTGLFPDLASAEQSYNSMAKQGYTKDDVNVTTRMQPTLRTPGRPAARATYTANTARVPQQRASPEWPQARQWS